MTSIFYIGITVFGINQASHANHSPLLQSVTQETGQQLEAPIILAAGIDTRVERRHGLWRIPPIMLMTNRTFVNNAGIVRVMDRIVVLTTDRIDVN
jgi:hypothetical protein